MLSATAISSQEPSRAPARWLLLIHQLPPSPAYLRLKVRRRLQKLGAQALKNSVYVLPNRAQSLEDCHWLRREILDAGGEATVSLADFVEGTSDRELEGKFRRASNAEYTAYVRAARKTASPPDDRIADQLATQLRQLVDRDFFDASGRAQAEAALRGALEGRPRDAASPEDRSVIGMPSGAVWVTRQDVYVDRMASAWLIRRFIDQTAHFKFVAATGYEPEVGELRFDMFEGEFTHELDRCTFQTLLRRFDLAQPELDAIGEIVQGIDLKFETSLHEETEGVRHMLRGICLARERDDERIDAATVLFDGLFAHFAQRGEA